MANKKRIGMDERAQAALRKYHRGEKLSKREKRIVSYLATSNVCGQNAGEEWKRRVVFTRDGKD